MTPAIDMQRVMNMYNGAIWREQVATSGHICKCFRYAVHAGFFT